MNETKIWTFGNLYRTTFTLLVVLACVPLFYFFSKRLEPSYGLKSMPFVLMEKKDLNDLKELAADSIPVLELTNSASETLEKSKAHVLKEYNRGIKEGQIWIYSAQGWNNPEHQIFYSKLISGKYYSTFVIHFDIIYGSDNAFYLKWEEKEAFDKRQNILELINSGRID